MEVEVRFSEVRSDEKSPCRVVTTEHTTAEAKRKRKNEILFFIFNFLNFQFT